MRIKIVNFNLVKKEPNSLELKAYLYQIKNDSFGLSDNITNAYVEKTGNSGNEGIDSLSDQEIQKILGDCCPTDIIYFRSHLDNIGAKNLHYSSFPELFTDIKQVSFDCDGIISMESYRSQIFSLYNAKGQRISPYCHDLDIGTDGLILLRSSSGPFWEMLKVEGDQLIETNHPRPYDAMYDFPDLMNRDAIAECLYPVFYMEDLYWDSSHLSINEVYKKLKNHEGDFRSLIPFYEDDEELATFAIEENILAFTFLSDRLKNNREFVFKLLEKGGDFLNLYSYLNDDFKSDIEIVRLCLDFSVNIIYRIAPIEDYEIMKRAVENHWSLFEHASDNLRMDRNFILQLATIDWRILESTKPDLYTDIDFVRKTVEVYNNCNDEKTDLIEVYCQLIHNKEGHLLIDSLLPIQDEDLFLKVVRSAKTHQINSMISGLNSSSIDNKDFWIKATKSNHEIVNYIPEKIRTEREFALDLIKINGDFLHALNQSFSSDPILFVCAMSQIKNRRGSTVISNIYPLLNQELKGNRSFMAEASTLDFHILAFCSDELKADINFLRSILKSTYGWAYTYANIELKMDQYFIQAAITLNTYLAKEIPSEALNNPFVIALLKELQIDLNKKVSDDDLPF